MIPYGKQTISNEDINAILETLHSDFLTSGPKIKEFEESFAEYVGSKYAVVVSSGTAALQLACLAAGLKKNEELLTSPMTFAASANCALYCGATPIFVDIKNNGLIDENLIETKINVNTRIIIPVHYTGNVCHMSKIKEIADKYNLIVIEDACHALGSKYKDFKVGGCRYSDMAVFSFHPVKNITTGEGGMITTNSYNLYDKLHILRNHGITKSPNKIDNKKEGPWHQEMLELGFNYRITDIQCALGISQLRRIGSFINRREKIAEAYDNAFKDIENIEIIREENDIYNSHHLYVIKVKDKETRLELFNYLKQNSIFCQVHYIPVYLHPYYKSLGYKKGICPNCEEFYDRILSLPIYPELSNKDQKKIIKKIEYFFNEFSNGGKNEREGSA